MSELIFKGKDFVYNHHLAVPFRPLLQAEADTACLGTTYANQDRKQR